MQVSPGHSVVRDKHRALVWAARLPRRAGEFEQVNHGRSCRPNRWLVRPQRQHCEIQKHDGSSEDFAKNKTFWEGRSRRKSVSGKVCPGNPDVVIDGMTPQ